MDRPGGGRGAGPVTREAADRSSPPTLALATAARDLESCTDLAALTLTCVRAVRTILGARSVALCRIEQETCRVIELDPPPRSFAGQDLVQQTFRADERPALRSLVRDHRSWVAHVDDPTSDPAELDMLDKIGMASSLGVPIIVHGLVWGSIYAVREGGGGPMDASDVAVVEVLAGLFAGGLMRVDLENQVQHLIASDPLTGLANRRVADHAVQTALASGQETCVVMCDVDGLKRINDELGHHRGDDLLRAVADVLRRASDQLPGSIAARLGGDEFCLVSVGVPRSRIAAVLEEATRTPLLHGATLSYGIATTAVTGPVSAHSLFRRADAAQYRAKRARARAATSSPAAAAPGHDRSAQDLLVAGLAAIDDLGSTAGTAGRLAAVAAATTELVDGANWYVSRLEGGTDEIVEVRRGTSSRRPDAAASAMPRGEVFLASAYPASAAAIGGGGFWADLGSGAGDGAELALLAESGGSALLAAGGPDGRGDGWLVEVEFDAISASAGHLVAAFRSLVAVALQDAR